MKRLTCLTLLLALSGCAGVHTKYYDLTVRPNGCQVTETRPTLFSTTATTVCWDASGRPIVGATTAGEPAIALPLAAISAGGTIIGAGAIGFGMIKAADNLSNIKIKSDSKVSGDVTGHVSGTVNGTVNGDSGTGTITP